MIVSIRCLVVVWWLLCVFVSSGCTGSQSSHFHILTSPALTVDSQLNRVKNTLKRVGIRRIQLPGYLNRPQIVTRSFDNELTISSSHQWAEPLSESILRVITDQLSRRLPTIHVSSFPWSGSQTQDVEIAVQFLQFEIVDQTTCVMDVKWTLFTVDDSNGISYQETLLLPVDQNGYQQYVAVQSEVLARLSAKIANSLADL
ncbi:MAG: PqiC family protein [Gammaproteobacteria bacterium]|nr:PqiC family protein [Gammaproteobacteria bacterium]